MVNNLEGEVWIPIKGFEGKYEVSNMGRVKSLNYLHTGNEKLLKLYISHNGYFWVRLYNNSKKGCSFRVNRLVYDAFKGNLPKFIGRGNGKKYKEINHINGIRIDNRLENLELITHSENMRQAGLNIAKSKHKKVYQYTLDGRLIKIWESVKSCKDEGYDKSCVAECCRGVYSSTHRCDYKGYIWSYIPLKEGGVNG